MSRRFYQENEFQQLAPLKDNWERIRDEAREMNAPLTGIHRVGKTHQQVFTELADHVESGGKYGWLDGWGPQGVNKDWVQLMLMTEDRPVSFLNGRMGATASLLSEIAGVKVAALVRLKAHTFLPIHRHAELAQERILQMHLTLEASPEHNYAYLNVEGDFRQHVPGELLIFDGSLVHFALNASPADRTILYVEFHRDGRPFPAG
ncbi:aspartyl/asparaginyl beta-hydroxylase domain-containing protein [Rhizobium laguerreae]|uniref:aspartyl/asparaginyl beta-hydroxylase domain-containing protein n=1 Tax=Rhizobium laguerreae TaxID=1076926 RepID=UPI001C928D29|nr:aspartyl/asparaginyl beta-hydroxylase domain-containing protein [Rhizobium laguerreae]MBY3425244.1 aspartyl/asparaginyl beta-hydroxylase domain-containing protein [Rhizobium laguerreae]